MFTDPYDNSSKDDTYDYHGRNYYDKHKCSILQKGIFWL